LWSTTICCSAPRRFDESMQNSHLRDAILDFWFADPEGTAQEPRKVWFAKDPSFDQDIRDRFLPYYYQAARGEFESWQDSAAGSLALIVLLDQFPRNMFRGQAQSFATDHQALRIAKTAIAQGFDQVLPPLQQTFIYMPLMHSEVLDDQQQCVDLFHQMGARDFQNSHNFAIRHRDIIQQYGRFPHRNAILGRDSTPAELKFLQEPGSSF
jgi:uncharacterized protein (DUF924 family)